MTLSESLIEMVRSNRASWRKWLIVGYSRKTSSFIPTSERNIFACDSCRSNGPENIKRRKSCPHRRRRRRGGPTAAKTERMSSTGAKTRRERNREEVAAYRNSSRGLHFFSPFFQPVLFFSLSPLSLALKDDDMHMCVYICIYLYVSNGGEDVEASRVIGERLGWTPKNGYEERERRGRIRASPCRIIA